MGLSGSTWDAWSSTRFHLAINGACRRRGWRSQRHGLHGAAQAVASSASSSNPGLCGAAQQLLIGFQVNGDCSGGGGSGVHGVLIPSIVFEIGNGYGLGLTFSSNHCSSSGSGCVAVSVSGSLAGQLKAKANVMNYGSSICGGLRCDVLRMCWTKKARAKAKRKMKTRPGQCQHTHTRTTAS